MSSIAPPNSTFRGSAFAVAWAIVAAGGLALMTWLVQFWGTHPRHADRLLIVAAGAWLLYRVRTAVRATPRLPQRRGLLLIAPTAVLVPAVFCLYAQVG